MAKTQAFKKETCLRPYFLGNKQITAVHIYDAQGVFWSVSRGWFELEKSSGNYNYTDDLKADDMNNMFPNGVRTARVEKFDGTPFVIKTELYLPADAFGTDRTKIKEVIAYKTGSETSYKNILETAIGNIGGKGCHRFELTEDGKLEVQFNEILKEVTRGSGLSYNGMEKLRENKDELIKLLKQL